MMDLKRFNKPTYYQCKHIYGHQMFANFMARSNPTTFSGRNHAPSQNFYPADHHDVGQP
ncbi:MAG: hypothetical protein JZU64_03695 [Rhodoferax sp.]|jgi:hypothetical protein|nr:hypothetical protein [Rhodoferax sp.]